MSKNKTSIFIITALVSAIIIALVYVFYFKTNNEVGGLQKATIKTTQENEDSQNTEWLRTGIEIFDKIINEAEDINNFSYHEQVSNAITVPKREITDVSIYNSQNYFKAERVVSNPRSNSGGVNYFWLDRANKRMVNIGDKGMIDVKYTLNSDGIIDSINPEIESNTITHEYFYYTYPKKINKIITYFEIRNMLTFMASLGIDANFSEINYETIDGKNCLIFANQGKNVVLSIWPEYALVMQIKSNFYSTIKSDVKINAVTDENVMPGDEELKSLEKELLDKLYKKTMDNLENLKE